MSPKRTKPLGPIKDLFFQDILRALEEVKLAPEAFEFAMADLLRDAIPGLTPVSGGSDQGFDGSIANGKREPYTLVCTTAEDAERNLRKSLRSYVENGWRTPKVAFVTSRRLIPGQRKRLRDIARKEGITLVQIFDRDALAIQLARNERWCKELLGVSFRVSALSAMPRSRRPLLEIPLVGREKDVEWLLKTPDDRLLVGEPGSGKTFLLYHLIRQKGWPALFLSGVEKGDDEIARAIREFEPKVVILDDAHTNIPLLDRLRHLRESGSVPCFDLVAATWRGGLTKVYQAFGGLPENRIRRLELLSRDEIVEVMRSVGLDVNDELMRFLVDQASNRPGLAVAIASRALQGEWKDLISGDFLAQDLLAFFESSSGPEVRQVLAGLSLGGDRGMAWEDVAEFLGLDFPRVQGIVTDLAVGGVLREVEPERGVLAVWPRVFRHALLRSVFFLGGISRSFKRLLDKAPSFPKAVEAILSAIEIRGEIDREEIHELVFRAASLRAWNQLAARSRVDAEWVLENYREDVRDVAEGALSKAPDFTIRKILEASDVHAVAGENGRSKSFGLLANWIEDFDTAENDFQVLIERRRYLATAARQFLASGGSPGVGLSAILLALSPKFLESIRDPGYGHTFSVRRGLLRVRHVAQLIPLWDLSKGAVREIDDEAWSYLASATWDWSDPQSAMMEDGVSWRRVLRDLGERVLRDLAPLARTSPGLSAGVFELATRLGVDLPIERDPILEVLFPSWVGRAELTRQPLIELQRARELAEMWSGLSPVEVAQRLAFYLSEGQRIGKRGSSNTESLCWILAESSEPRLPWVEAFLVMGLERGYVRPFLQFAVEKKETGWEAALTRYLGVPELAQVALRVALASHGLSGDLLGTALLVATEYPDEVYSTSISGGRNTPLSTMRGLLGHSASEVSLAAAVGEWNAEPRAQVRSEILVAWRNAIIRSNATDAGGIGYLQEAILLEDPDLAAAWFSRQIEGGGKKVRFVDTIARSLRPEAKAEFLRKGRLHGSLVPVLVDGDPGLFQALLENPNHDLRPAALAREPDDAWAVLVGIAARQGVSTTAIADVSYPLSAALRGSGVPTYEARDAKLTLFENHPDPNVREVVRIMRERNASKLRDARNWDRQIGHHGLVGWLDLLRRPSLP